MNIVLYEKLIKAVKAAFTELFEKHNEEFYYCTLITDGEGSCPFISAWSREAFNKYIKDEEISKDEELDYKWSYADSPYCTYGWEYFKDVEEYIIDNKPSYNCDIDDWNLWTNSVIDTMEKVLVDLDNQGLFGTGEVRKSIVINAEIMPPDYTNTLRALRLNDEANIKDWLEEIAEESNY